MRRTDPEGSTRRYFRAQDRVFSQNGQWYFTTREGEMGPFRRRETALQEVTRYAQERQDLEHFQQARQRAALHDSGDLTLSILPKEDESDLSLDGVMLMESQR